MAITHEGNILERERFTGAANTMARCYQAGLGRCLSLAVAPGTNSQAAELLRSLLSELGLRCSASSISHSRNAALLEGIWIIDNADMLSSFEITAWMKTLLDMQFPSLRIVLIHDLSHAPSLTKSFDLVGAIAVDW